MGINDYLHLLVTIQLIIAYHSLQASDGMIYYPPIAYGQNQSSSFQAAVRFLDNIPAQTVKVGDIDMSIKQLGNNTYKPIVLINGECY